MNRLSSTLLLCIIFHFVEVLRFGNVDSIYCGKQSHVADAGYVLVDHVGDDVT
jgi:hypothetical protein